MINTLSYVVAFFGIVVFAQQPIVPFAPRVGVFNNPYNTPRVPFAAPNTLAAPYVPIVDYSNEINVDGSYRYSFVTADGKQAEESGYLKDVSVNKDGEPIGVQVVQGSYSYTAPDGTPVQVTYIADENGFQPTSVRLPLDGRLSVNPAEARVAPFAAPFRNPYNPSPLIGRYTQPALNNYNINQRLNNN